MFREIFRFEVISRLKRPMIYIFFFIMAGCTFGAVATDSIQVGGAIGNINRNAPFVITQMTIVMSMVGLFLIPAFVSAAILRDFELNTFSSFFTSPLSKYDYLLGRFTGGIVVAFLTLSGAVFGILLGSYMPWIDPDQIGPTILSSYVASMFVFVLPNILFVGGICFALATTTRSMLYSYLGIIAVFVGYAITQAISVDLENRFLAMLIDPFGLGAFTEVTRYWTPVERNSVVIAFQGPVMLNRLIWLVISGGIIAFSFITFKPTLEASKGFRRSKKRRIDDSPAGAVIRPMAIPVATQKFSFGLYFRQFLNQARLEYSGVIKSVSFIVMTVLVLMNVVGGASFEDAMYGITTYPVTRLMLRSIDGSYIIFAILILIFYAGEMIWKERQIKLSGMYDSLPVPSWIPYFSKLLGLMMVAATLQFLVMLTTMGVQLYHGYTHFELGLYFQGLFLDRYLSLIVICVLAMFFHVIANNKYIGYMLMALYYIVLIVASAALDFNHYLYRFGMTPPATYSDMNGYGHFIQPLVWFHTYWLLFAVLLTIVSLLFWMRGTEETWKARFKLFKQRLTISVRIATAVTLILIVLTGSYIFYNTNILNTYRTEKENQRLMAEYEKQYKQYEGIPQPRITDVTCEVDIYPNERNCDIRGAYVVKNKSQVAIDSVHVLLDPNMEINSLDIPTGKLVSNDKVQGYYIYELGLPMSPADSMIIIFDLSYRTRGFRNNGSNTDIVENGTFINNYSYFPHFGYNQAGELADKNERKKFDLPPKERMPKLGDETARKNTYIANDADWVTFEATVSTISSQVAIAPGYLQKEWQKNGRRYFHYKMDAPILNFYSFLSAEYEIKRDRWNDVAIEIYYHPGHEYNVARMIKGIKCALDYYTANFSPYQHKQARILEFPAYASFAQSFPNTIPFSEGIGFIARIDDHDEDIDTVFFVTVHEMAHQWWAHQVIGAGMQGCTLLSESLAQYSTMMVMEKEYGSNHMRQFLKYELDKYLEGRGGERQKELPLMKVENQQYIHYHKGCLIMYALKDYIGEENLNRALSDYIAEVGFQEPPYTTSLEFMRHIRAATPDSLQYILEDMFETITLFENKVNVAEYTANDDGTYTVTMTLDTRKIRADSLGVESEIPINDWIDVGIFAGEPTGDVSLGEKVLYLQKHQITPETKQIEIMVDEEPSRAGIDPYNKLIDRQPDDNTKRLEKVEKAELISER